jgi:hypothetical protein
MHHTLGLGERWLHASHHKVVLAGRVDSKPPTRGAPPPDYAEHDYAIVLHEAFKGAETAGGSLRKRGFFLDDAPWPLLGADHGDQPELRASEHEIEPIYDYTDPLAKERPEYGGSWIAGAARVGSTELVVIVQERYAEAIGPPVALAKSVVLWGWSGLAAVVVGWGLMMLYRGQAKRWPQHYASS